MSLVDLSESFANAVASASPGVLSLSGRATAAVWEPGVALAAAHTLDRVGEPRLRIGEAWVPASVAGVDPGTDIAVLKFTGNAVPPQWSEATPRVGHLVFAVSPERTTVSIVQSVGGPWRTHGGGRVDLAIETGLGPWPGFSGSLLVDASGRAIGLNTSGLGRRSSRAIPTKTLRRVVAELLEHGRPRRAFLGVGTVPARLDSRAAAATSRERGLLVVDVQADGPADKAGLRVGDILLAIEGDPLERPYDLLARLDGDRVGAAVTFQVVRAGEPVDVGVTLGSR